MNHNPQFVHKRPLLQHKHTGYDSLNRLITASSQATTGADCWGQSIPTDETGYDRYGNLKTINSTKCSSQALAISVDTTTNRINSANFGYDAAGNLLSDGIWCSYAWDAEGRQVGIYGEGCVTASYVYDGDGRRVEKTVIGTTTLFWPDLSGDVLTETDGGGSLLKDYIYFAGQKLGYVYNHSVKFYFGDQIGTSRVVTYDNGQICYDADFYPFGGERTPYANTCPPQNYGQNYKFAGMERDSETQNDHTMFRYYASNYGRWLSPDPLGGDISNPQSLNRYAYALNNPANSIDPSGMDSVNCSQAPPRPDLSWAPDCTHLYQTPCNGMVCADGAYGGEQYVGFAAIGSPHASCSLDGVLTNCGTVVGFGDEFNVLLHVASQSGPPAGFEPVSKGAQSSCPGCYWNPSGFFQDAIWDPSTDVASTFFMWDISWTFTGPTAWSFNTKLNFQQTVQTLKNVGLVENWVDHYNFFHPHELDLRDNKEFCSLHVGVDKGTGNNGVPTTGEAHLDAVNPYPGPPGRAADSLIPHGVLDILRVYPGSKACAPY